MLWPLTQQSSCEDDLQVAQVMDSDHINGMIAGRGNVLLSRTQRVQGCPSEGESYHIDDKRVQQMLGIAQTGLTCNHGRISKAWKCSKQFANLDPRASM